MRLHIGQLPATPNFSPQAEGWTPLKEPGPLTLSLVAAPVGILAAVLVAKGWGETSVKFEFGLSGLGHWAPVVYAVAILGIGLPVLIAVHELIHTLGYPKFGLTPSTMIAVWPSKLLFLAINFEALRRNRLLLVYLLPLLVMSILPLIVYRALELSSLTTMLVSTANALFAGGDIVGFLLIL